MNCEITPETPVLREAERGIPMSVSNGGPWLGRETKRKPKIRDSRVPIPIRVSPKGSIQVHFLLVSFNTPTSGWCYVHSKPPLKGGTPFLHQTPATATDRLRQHLSIVAWAYATLEFPNRPLLTALCHAAVRKTLRRKRLNWRRG